MKKNGFCISVDGTSRLNVLKLRLQRKDKLIPMLVNDIAFKMKFEPFISQLKSKGFG